MKRVYLSQVQRNYDMGLIHNPNHFIPSSLYIEQEGGRIYLKGRHFKKHFTKIAVLTPKNKLPAILNPNFIAL